MHFVDKDNFVDAPILILQALHKVEQIKWIRYRNKIKYKSEPIGKWTDDSIRSPLAKLFMHNCGYCGKSTLLKEGEVDHYFPKSLDELALYIYDWDNYIWSCSSCNGAKDNNIYVLNPCQHHYMDGIYYHAATGRYLTKPSACQELVDLFNNTEKWTFINGDDRQKGRIRMVKYIDSILNRISYIYEQLILEYEDTKDQNLPEYITLENNLRAAFLELKGWLNTDYLYLAKYIIEQHKANHSDTFPYSFEFFYEGDFS